MKIRTIGFGYLKTLGNYENCKVYMEAELEDREEASESLNLLRTKVAEEMNLHDEWHGLRERFHREKRNLEATSAALQEVQQRLEKAQQNWKEFADCLIAHGIGSRLITEREIKINSEPPYREDYEFREQYEEDLKKWIVKLLQPVPPISDSISNETPLVGNEYDECFGSDDAEDLRPDYYDQYHGPESDEDDDY